MSYQETKESSSSEDNEDYEQNLRVLAVIESNNSSSETIVKKTHEKISELTQVSKTWSNNKARNVSTVKTEVILLDDPPTAQISVRSADDNNTCNTKFRNKPRVIELSDDKSKMELRREFKVDVSTNSELSVGVSSDSRKNVVDVKENDGEDNENVDDGSADILSRLPPGTILIKQRGNCVSSSSSSSAPTTSGIARICSREDSDYVHDSSKESTGTNSSESSSTASYNTAGKVRRMQYRSVRSKKVVEVRRNPVRNKKKKPLDDDFTRPRQRLLAIKRKTLSSIVDDATARKRPRIASTPYMNTRSVTRKMYTVGATYQAPNANDALEWKEWPSHGMHERPIWHPQIGLAYEYNERTYVSLDGENYREIIEDPVIEVVSVDPHHERVTVSCDRRNFERMTYYNQTPRSSISNLDLMDNSRDPYVQATNSFQSCMHGSFHSVLAYCSRLVPQPPLPPTYKRNLDIRPFSRMPDDTPGNSRTATKPTESMKFSQDPSKMRLPSMFLPATGAAANLAKNSETKNFSSNSSNEQIPKCLVIPRKSIHFTNVRNIQGNILQEVFNRSSKNTLIFLKPTDPPGKTAEKIAAALKSSSTNPNKTNPVRSKVSPDTATAAQLNLTKLDDSSISDEALMEMSSSIYNNLLPTDETMENNKSYRTTSYMTRPVTALVATKIPMKQSIAETSSMDNANSKRASCSGYRSVTNPNGSLTNETSNSTRFGYTNQAAEIAKILAEYNQKSAKNSSIRNANNCYTSSAAASNFQNVRSTTNTRNLRTTNQQQCINNATRGSSFMSMMEQTKNSRIKREHDSSETTNERNSYDVNSQQSRIPNFRKISSTVTSEQRDVISTRNDDDQAMDLTMVRKSENKIERKIEMIKTEDSRKWLQELIEDTAMLYCAAAGTRQGDVSEYMETLDSVQSLQWLGS